MGPSKGKILSVAWGPPSPNPLRSREQKDPNGSTETPSEGEEDVDETEWIDQWIATGGSDAAVKRWNIKSGTAVANLKTDQLRSTRTLVWAIGVLADGTIVSGDSMGLVKFWDTRTSTQLSSIKAHEADILCLAIGSDGTTVLTSGVDQNITECALVRTKTEYGQRADWVKTSCRRLHTHDVRALAVWPPYTPFPPSFRLSVNPGMASLLVSGGQDMIPIITPCAAAGTGTNNALLKTRNPLAINENLAVVRPCTFSQSIQERIPYPIHGLVCVAKDARLLVCRRLTGVSIWRLHPGGGGAKGAQEFDHVIDMEMNVSTHIIACAISDDGNWLAVSDAMELKLFYINGAGDFRPVRIKNISTLLIGALDSVSSTIPSAAASGLLFTPDSTRLVVACSPSSAVVMFDLPRSLSGDVRHLRTFVEHSLAGPGRVVKKLAGDSSLLKEDGSRPHSALLTTMTVSPDGQWLATADERGHCNVFNLDSLQHHCTLPSFERPIRDMKFHSDSPQILVLAQVNNSIQVFDVESRTFPGWAKNVTTNLPEKFKGLKPGVEGLLFVKDLSSATTKHQLLAWGWNWICKIKLDGPMAKRGKSKKSRSGWIPKDEWDLERDSLNIFSGYRHMLGVAPLGGNEVVVVERPALDLMMIDGLPPSFYKHKFGT
ncbi:U3 small nucleolar RNA-associated protein [Tulasnella sp. 408]|nr:U3 small nucleolar RNA-associated protein [Tulasnella sp. 408]